VPGNSALLLPRGIAAVLFLGLAGCGDPGANVAPDAGYRLGDAALTYETADLVMLPRARALVARMTLDEKVSQLGTTAPAISRLGIPAYQHWNEGLHGLARGGPATAFPQSIGLAASFDPDVARRVARAVAQEARAKFHDELARTGGTSLGHGLTIFAPNVNLFRDPRWGRGQETYGEDPLLTGRVGVAYVHGLQGDDPVYLQAIATVKHFAVHSGPEATRHSFDAEPTRQDLVESYLPQFEAVVREGGARSVMSAYNRLYGEPCASNPWLLDELLRVRWKFAGYVVTDCYAIEDLYGGHHVASSPAEAAARAVGAGADLECGSIYQSSLADAVRSGLVGEDVVDRAVERVMLARLRLGAFDVPSAVPYASMPLSTVDSAEHRALARDAAARSLVLLRNEGGLLPLTRTPMRIAVIGPNADSLNALLGDYACDPTSWTTILAGIRTAAPTGSTVVYAYGSELASELTAGFADAVSKASAADVVVLALGLSPSIENEKNTDGAIPAGDRTTLALPGVQEALLEAIVATGKPVVLVVAGGSALDLTWASEHVPAILLAWYGGEEGGAAVADALFGRTSPAGRLPITFYRSVADLPPFDDYAMEGRTYRFFHGTALYPFGFGLSYATFGYSALVAPATVEAGEGVTVRVDVANTSALTADEVVELYVRDEEASVRVPIRRLADFTRVSLAPGERRTVALAIEPRSLAVVTTDGRRVIEPGTFVLSVGGGQPDSGDGYAAPASGLTTRFDVTGVALELE